MKSSMPKVTIALRAKLRSLRQGLRQMKGVPGLSGQALEADLDARAQLRKIRIDWPLRQDVIIQRTFKYQIPKPRAKTVPNYKPFSIFRRLRRERDDYVRSHGMRAGERALRRAIHAGRRSPAEPPARQTAFRLSSEEYRARQAA